MLEEAAFAVKTAKIALHTYLHTYLVSVGANILPRRRKPRKQEHEELVPFWEKTAALSRGSTDRLCARSASSISTIYVCMWYIMNEKILVALLPEKERKVDVFFGDKKQLGKRKSKETANKIVAAKIPVKFEGNDHKLLHHKL